MSPDVQESVSVPQGADAVANAIAECVLAIIELKKSGASGATFLGGAAAAVLKLEPVIGAFGELGAEMAAEPLGFAEAFALAGFKVARQMTGK